MEFGDHGRAGGGEEPFAELEQFGGQGNAGRAGQRDRLAVRRSSRAHLLPPFGFRRRLSVWRWPTSRVGTGNARRRARPMGLAGEAAHRPMFRRGSSSSAGVLGAHEDQPAIAVQAGWPWGRRVSQRHFLLPGADGVIHGMTATGCAASRRDDLRRLQLAPLWAGKGRLAAYLRAQDAHRISAPAAESAAGISVPLKSARAAPSLRAEVRAGSARG